MQRQIKEKGTDNIIQEGVIATGPNGGDRSREDLCVEDIDIDLTTGQIANGIELICVLDH